LPYESVEAVPPNLRPLIAGNEPEPGDESQTPRGTFELGRVYYTDSDGHILTNAGGREVGALQARAAEQAWCEEQADEPLHPDVAAVLKEKHNVAAGP
jgi:hypothetical protein